MSETPLHRLSFVLGEEGSVYGWRVAECPGPEHCKTYVEGDCRCTLETCPCRSGEHWNCDEYEDDNNSDIAPGCSIRVMDSCGLDDYLGDIGGDMIDGEVTMFVMATHRWEGTFEPMFHLEFS